jgi:hypothetical protein
MRNRRISMERVNSIFDFFGNDDFVKANKGKMFSIEEEVAIIIYNKTQPLEIKFQALEQRKSMLPNNLARDVEQWIEDKRKVFSYVQNINREDIVFVIRFDGNVANEKVFRTYKQAMGNSMCCFGLSIEKVNSTGEKTWGTVGRVDVDEDGNVIDVTLLSNKMEGAPKHSSKLYDIKVKFGNPYKPFDLLELPIRNAFHIVADSNDIKVKEYMKSQDRYSWNGWIDLEIPTYTFAVLDGGYLYESSLKGMPFSLDKIKRIDYYNQTVRQKEMIDEIKALVKERNQ